MHGLFKGDATPLIQMERQGLIRLEMTNSRHTSIKPGKPLYRTAFVQMTKDERQTSVMS
jgi:hypothetical protein